MSPAPIPVTIHQTPRGRAFRFVLRRILNLILGPIFAVFLQVLLPQSGLADPMFMLACWGGGFAGAIAITGW